MTRRPWPVAIATSLLICLSSACASFAHTPTKPTATLAAATSTPTPTLVLGSTPGAEETTTDMPAPPPSATATPNATLPPSATPTQDLGAMATALHNQTGTQGHTGPSDIPIVGGATQVLTATDAEVIFQTATDLATIIKFYMDQMPQNGWTLGGATTLAAPPTTTMTFTKANRSAAVSIVAPPGAKQLLVSIVITSK